MSDSVQHRKQLRCTGAILAGGQSSRMGEPKQNFKLHDGRTMIEHVHAALLPLCERIVILGECESLTDLKRVRDLRPDQGPLGGIESLLASGIDEQYLICPCDLPWVSSDLLAALLEATDAPATHFFDHPLPARISADALMIVQQSLNAEQRAVWRLMEALGAQPIAIPAGCEELLRNVNKPQDIPSGRE